MATITSAASGNFSAGATWVGGVVPGAADVAIAATGHIVAIDVDVTVTELRQAGTGKFTLGNGRTINGNVYNVAGTLSTGGAVEFVATTSATINGNVVNAAGAGNAAAVVVTGSGSLSINGNLSNVASSSSTYCAAIRATTVGGDVTITGTLTGPAASPGNTAAIVWLSAARTFNIVGNLFGTTGTSTSTVIVAAEAGTVNITGNVTGAASGASAAAVLATGSSIVNVTGVVTGGGAADATGVTASSTATVTVIGTVNAGAGLRAHGISSSATSNGVVVTGNIVDTQQGTSAIYARLFRLGATNSGFTRYANSTGFPSGGVVSRVSPDNVTGMPAVGNVRHATVYGYNNELTGTLRVPPASSVASGVPVDATTGTAALSPADVAALVGAQIAAAFNSTP